MKNPYADPGTIDLDQNALETLHYDFDDFPVYSRQEYLSDYPNRRALCHWHEDYEFIYIVEGQMNFFVDGSLYLLTENTAIFVNTEKLHYGYSDTEEECLFRTFIFPPKLFATSEAFIKKYLEPFARDCPAILLNPVVVWQQQVLELLQTLYGICSQPEHGFELLIQNRLLNMWTLLYRNYRSDEHSLAMDPAAAHELKGMLHFIQTHYPETITLQDIADVGRMCRSKCCRLFREYLKTTPGTYLNQYRLKKAGQLLRETGLSVLEIALSCGFQSPSYFTEYFRRETGQTPTGYRQQGKSAE